jgi:uncharacterized protein (UPF0335 family)
MPPRVRLDPEAPAREVGAAEEAAPSATETRMDDINPSTAGQLKAFIERIERLEEEKRQIADDIKDVYAEAKGTGFDAKILRKIVSLRRQDANERREQEEILDTYLRALGME